MAPHSCTPRGHLAHRLPNTLCWTTWCPSRHVPACQVAAAQGRRGQGAHALQQLLLDCGRQRRAPRGPARALARLRNPSRLRRPGGGPAARRGRRRRRARAFCGVDDRHRRRVDPDSPGGAARPRDPESARGLSRGGRCPAARIGARGCAGSGAGRRASRSPAAALRPRSGPLCIGPLCVRVIVAAAAEDRGHARVRRARACARRSRPRAGAGASAGARGCIAGGVAGGVERGRRGVDARGGRGQAVAQQDAGAQQTLTARVRGAARLTYVRLPRAINVKGGKGAATWLLARQL